MSNHRLHPSYAAGMRARSWARKKQTESPARDPTLGAQDRGTGTLELVVIFPVVLLLIFAIIQTALLFHARNVALAAAQEGVKSATAYGATPAQATRAAQNFLDTAGQGVLQNSRVSRVVSGQVVTVTVSGESAALVPGFRLGVDQSAAGPIERFTGR